MTRSLALVCALLPLLAQAQTPPGSSPSTNTNLGLSFGNFAVTTPGQNLPGTVTAPIPTITYNATNSSAANQSYSLFCMDLSIGLSQVNTSALSPGQLPLPPGLKSGTTSLVQYWQPNLMLESGGKLSNVTAPFAQYIGPVPPPGQTHTYVFYLFQQAGANITLPFNNTFNVIGSDIKIEEARVGYSVADLAQKTGDVALVAANYIQVTSPGMSMGVNGTSSSNSTSGTNSTSTGGSGSSMTGGSPTTMTSIVMASSPAATTPSTAISTSSKSTSTASTGDAGRTGTHGVAMTAVAGCVVAFVLSLA